MSAKFNRSMNTKIDEDAKLVISALNKYFAAIVLWHAYLTISRIFLFTLHKEIIHDFSFNHFNVMFGS